MMTFFVDATSQEGRIDHCTSNEHIFLDKSARII
jgi:hypothetical protein